MKVILASGSPRRSEILKLAGYEFDVIPSSADETMGSGELCDNVMELAGRKAREVASGHPAALVIGADTVVSCGGEIMGKPGDGEDAVRMLKELSESGTSSIRACASAVLNAESNTGFMMRRRWSFMRWTAARSRNMWPPESRWTRRAHMPFRVWAACL